MDQRIFGRAPSRHNKDKVLTRVKQDLLNLQHKVDLAVVCLSQTTGSNVEQIVERQSRLALSYHPCFVCCMVFDYLIFDHLDLTKINLTERDIFSL